MSEPEGQQSKLKVKAVNDPDFEFVNNKFFLRNVSSIFKNR